MSKPEPHYMDVYEPCACDGCTKPGAAWWDCIRIIPGDRKPVARYQVESPATTAEIDWALAQHPGCVVIA